MKRRDSLKTLSITSLGMAAVPSTDLVASPPQAPKPIKATPGRVGNEAAHDAKLMAEKFFTATELQLLAVLSDIIIPADGKHPSASKVGVPSFIEFMAKDQPGLQTPLRGGMAWLNLESKKRFTKDFTLLTQSQKLQIIDDIAYTDQIKPGMSQGVSFFTTLRGLVLTGYYTTKEGFEDLGYVGNRPNQWEGVPQDVLDKYGLSY